MKSYNEDNSMCIRDVLVATWVWRRNPDLEEIPFTCEIRGYDQLFVNVPEYSDLI